MTDFQQCVLQEEIPSSFVPFLESRGIQSCSALFKLLHPDIDHLYSPFGMKDMHRAIVRLKKAISSNEKILIYGDYDVDGITSVALMLKMLKKLGNNALYYIPNRLEDGYGMSIEGVRYAKEKGVKLIITVDCGISAADEIKYADELGMDVIVTDHHKVSEKLPPAYAVLNPHRQDDNYPFKELAGVGVAFKLLQGLYEGTDMKTLLWNLDLVALGTLADAVSLRDENRIFAKFGMRILKKGTNAGIYALKDVAGALGKKITEHLVGFYLAPRLNASGRMGNADKGLELLMTGRPDKAKRLSKDIEMLNIKRKDIQNRMTAEAIKMAKINGKVVNVVFSSRWHRGVMGIVAARLSEKFNEPFIVMTAGKNGEVSGSGRSVKYIDIVDVLKECDDLLISYGGHSQACGVSLEKDRLPEFTERFTTIIKTKLRNEKVRKTYKVDSEISLDVIDNKFLDTLDILSPFGIGFTSPIFLVPDVKICRNKGWYACQGNKRIKIDVFRFNDISQNERVNIIGNVGIDVKTGDPIFRLMDFLFQI